MSIINEIKRIKESTQKAYESAKNKGATIPKIKNIDNLSVCIDSIQGGGSEPTPPEPEEDTKLKEVVEGTIVNLEDDTATKIKDYCFYKDSSLQTINMSKVESIGDYAFQNATALTSVSFPLLKTIGKYGFANCSKLSSEIVSDSITTIKANAFQETPITKLHLKNLINIPNYVAFECRYLTSVDMPNATTVDDESNFCKCYALSSVSLPKLQRIAMRMFQACALTEATFESATYLARGCFFDCSKLETINLPNVTEMGQDAFSGGCSSLKNVNMPKLHTISSSNGFNSCIALEEISLPELTKINGASTFARCKKLKSINFPKLTDYSGDSTFRYCSALETVTLPAIKIVGNRMFEDCTSLSSASFPTCTRIYGAAFQDDVSLVSVDAPETTIIDGWAFYNTQVIKLKFPKLVNINGDKAFMNCKNLSALLLANNKVCTLANSNAFTGTPIASGTGYIYVNDDLVDSYKLATNWTVYKNQIKPISEYVE